MYKNRVFKISLIIFIAINLIIFKNLGLYNDDWLFYNINNQTFLEWSLRVWNGEGGVIKRHVVVPYYIILHLVSPFFIYCFSLILSLIIFVFFIQLITKIVNQNILDKNKKDISLNFIFLTFVIWYFFPFNIGGQFGLQVLFIQNFLLFFF